MFLRLGFFIETSRKKIFDCFLMEISNLVNLSHI